MRRRFLLVPLAILSATCLRAETLTRELQVDLNTLVKSRDLSGFALREDGRLHSGPRITELSGEVPGIIWCAAPYDTASSRWLVGTGPEATILDVRMNGDALESRPWAALGPGNVQSLVVLDDRRVVAVTSPGAVLFLLEDGRIVSRLPLGAEAAWRIERAADGRLLVATGSPARVYAVDVSALQKAGVNEAAPRDEAAFQAAGVRQLAEIRERHARSLLVTRDGRIFVGSSPKGNVFLLGEPGSAPKVLTEGREGEVTDLLETTSGDILAAITLGQATAPAPGDPSEALMQAMQMQMDAAGAGDATLPGSPRMQRGNARSGGRAGRDASGFSGQGGVHDVTPGRFPALLFSRAGSAFYGLAERKGKILVSGGERGEVFLWDPVTRKSSLLAGSGSAQNLQILKTGSDDEWLILRNNLAGLSRLSFAPGGPRSLVTGPIDLGGATRLGSLVINRIRPEGAPAPSVKFQASLAADDAGTWTDWTPAAPTDGGRFLLADTPARRLRLKFEWADGSIAPEGLARAFVYHLPQNQRPQLESFRILPQNVGLIRNPEPPQQPFVPLMQYLNGVPQQNTGGNNTPGGGPPAAAQMNAMRNQGFLGSPLVQAVGTQIVVWNVTDPNGDELLHTLSIRPESGGEWTDLVVRSRETFAQFDVSALADGPYVLRLRSEERQVHPDGALELLHEDDSLVVDNSLPEVLAAETRVEGGIRQVSITARDATSRLDHAVFLFNNGREEKVHNPVDGILDAREETFVLRMPDALVGDANSVEAVVFDGAGNGQVRRLALTR